MRKLFVDCTDYYKTSHDTGIQRTIKSLLPEVMALSQEKGYVVIPVVASGNHYFRVEINDSIDNGLKNNTIRKARSILAGLDIAISSRIDNGTGSPFKRSLGRAILKLRSFAGNWIRHIENILVSVSNISRKHRVVIEAGDIHLQLDAFWHEKSQIDSYRKRKIAGVYNVMMLYDIIPITHSNYFDSQTIYKFRTALAKTIPYTDLIIGISKNVLVSLRSGVLGESGITDNLPELDYIYLGCDIGKLGQNLSNSKPINENGYMPYYLSVGTLAAHKRIDVILDAFDRYWNDGGQSNLVLVGRKTRNNGRVIKKIEKLMNRYEKVFYLPNVSDSELQRLYGSAVAVISASDAEGFGLPIVEAFAHGRPVIASDIPVFTELGGKYINYFEAGSSKSLCEQLKNPELRMPDKNMAEKFTWKTSAETLFDTIEKHYAK